MLNTLTLRGFRGFASYRLSGLARVNLLVGENNSGKTSVLEAVELLASGGDPRVLYNSLRRRGERVTDRVSDHLVDISHIFHGHDLAPGVNFALSSDNSDNRKDTLKAEILSLEDVEDKVRRMKEWQMRRHFGRPFGSDEDVMPVFGMSIKVPDGPQMLLPGLPEREILLPVMEEGTIGIGHGYARSIRNSRSGTPVQFLALDAFDPASMAEQWNTVLKEGLETEIVTDMRLLQPDLDSIHFLPRTRSGSDILLGLENDRRRTPIGTYGDGMRQLLALRLSFVGAANGVLLIDEIDAGLHWRVMEEMWQFVVEVAKRLNVQVFATTHSLDCIKGLGSLLRNRPDLEEQVSLQRVTRSLAKAVRLQGDQVRIAVKQDIEVR